MRLWGRNKFTCSIMFKKQKESLWGVAWWGSGKILGAWNQINKAFREVYFSVVSSHRWNLKKEGKRYIYRFFGCAIIEVSPHLTLLFSPSSVPKGPRLVQALQKQWRRCVHLHQPFGIVFQKKAFIDSPSKANTIQHFFIDAIVQICHILL